VTSAFVPFSTLTNGSSVAAEHNDLQRWLQEKEEALRAKDAVMARQKTTIDKLSAEIHRPLHSLNLLTL
jgi:hypothetical protein